MIWLRRNFLALLGCLIFLCLIGGSFYLLLETQKRQREVQSEYFGLEGQYRDLTEKTVTPSQHNVDLLKDQTRQLEAYYQDIFSRLPKDRRTYEPMQPWAFKGYLETQIGKTAQYCKTNKVQLPSGFSCGFSIYDTQPPKMEDTPKLIHQLDLIENIVDLLVKSKVLGISSVKRTYLEGEADSSGKENVTGGIWKQDPNLIYESQVFEVSFQANFDQLRTVLNHLARSTNMVVLVRNLSVETEQVRPPEPSEAKPDAATAPNAAMMGLPRNMDPAFGQPNVGRGGRGVISPDGRDRMGTRNPDIPKGVEIAMGNEISTVTLRLEVVELKEPQEEPEDAPRKKKAKSGDSPKA